MTDFSSKLVIPTPPELARITEDGLLAKATKPWSQTFLLSLTGGAFIALGFVFYVTSQQGLGAPFPAGPAKLLGGLVFSAGLVLVVISGSDLFTGTTMTVMPLLSKRLAPGRWIAHWGMSLFGNLIGALTIALIIQLAGTPSTNKSAWGLIVLNTSLSKVSHTWFQAFLLALMANFAVCLAVWLANAGRTTTDKVLGIIGPITLFVGTGFEHSVANMFMLPMGLLVKNTSPDSFWQGDAVVKAGKTVADYDALTIGSAIWNNLIPVILGNIVGGAVFVGVYFWLCYLRPAKKSPAQS